MELDSDEEIFFGPVTTPELRARAKKGLSDNDKTLVNFSFHFSSESDTEDEKDSLDSGGGLKPTDANPPLHHKDSPYDLDASADISSNKGYFQDSLQTLEGSESSLMSLERKGKRVASTPMNRDASLSPDSLDCTLHESHDDSCDITDGSFTHANFKEYFICPSDNRFVKLTDWAIPSVDSTSLAQADMIELNGNKIDFNLKPNDLCFSSQKGTPVIKCINRSLGNGLSIAACDSKGLQLAGNLDSNLLLEKPTETMTAVNRLPPVNTVNTVLFDTSSLHQLSTPDLSVKEIQPANTSNSEYSLQNDMKNNAFRDGNLELNSADIESCILDVHGPASQNLQVRKKPLSEEPCQSTLDENSVMDEQLPLDENINVIDVESYENVPIQEFAAYSPNTPSREVAGATSILKDSGFLDVSAFGTTSTMNGVSSSSNFLTASAACNMVRGFDVSGNSDSGADTSTKNSSALHISNLGDENMLEVKVPDFNVLNISTASDEILCELKIEPLDIGVETQNRSNDLITDTSIKSSSVLHISNLEDANENTLEVKGSDFNVSDISTASEEILSELKIEPLDIDVETQNRSNDLTIDTSIKNSSALYISNLGDANENALEVEVSDFNVSNISTASEEILPGFKNEPLDIDVETQNRSDDLALCNESDSHVTCTNNDTVLENSAHFSEQEENHEVIISMDVPEGQMIYVDIHADEEPKAYEDALTCGDTIDVDENLECAQDNGQGGEAECNANNNLSKERAIECEESRTMQNLNASMITIEKFMSSETFQEDSEILSEDSIIQEDAHCMEQEDTLATLSMSTAECIQGSESEDRKKEECETRIANHIYDPTVFQDENQGLLQDKSDMSLIKVLHDSQLDNSCLLEESVSQNERKAGQDFEGTGRVAIDDVQQRLIYTDFTIARETMIQDASDFIQEQDGDLEKSTRCGLHASDMSLTCLETVDYFNITKFNVQHLSECNQFVSKDDGNISQDANSNDIVEESNPTDHTLENITVLMEDHENGKDCEHTTLQNNFNAAQELGDHLTDGTTQEIVDPDVISQEAEYHDVNDVTNEKNQENCSFSQESKDNVCETTEVIIDNEVPLSIEVDSSKEVTAEVDIQGTNDKIIVEMVEQLVHDVGILTKCPSIQVTEDINFLEVSNFNRVLEDSVNETSCIELSLTVDETRQVGNAENQQENHGFIQELEDSFIDEIEVINKIARQPEEQCCTNEMSEKFCMQESSSFASEAIEENYLNFNDDEDCLELDIQQQSLMTPETAVDDSAKSQHFNDSCTRTDGYMNDITETLQELSLTLEVESNGQNEFQETRKIELEAKNDIAGNESQIVDDIGEEGIVQEGSSMYKYLQDSKVCEHKSLTSESIQMTVKAIPEKQEIHNGCDVIADDAENASCLIYSQDLFPEQHEKVPAPNHKTGGHDLNQNSDDLNEESVENDPSPTLPILHCINDNLEDSSSISDENRKEESLTASFLETFDRNLKISDISVSNVKQEARIEAASEKKIFTTKFIKNFTLQSDNLEILKAFDFNDSQEIPNSPHVDNSLEESSPRSISVMGEVLDDLKMEDKDSGSGDLSFISNICMVDELSFDEENRLRKLKDLRSAENSKNSSFMSNSSENPPNENSTLQNENFDDEIRKVVKDLVDKAVLQTDELSHQANSNCVLEIPNDASDDCPLNVNDVESGAHEDFPTISLESSCFSYNDVTKMNRSLFHRNLQKDMEHKLDDQFIQNNGNCSTLFENSPSLNAELYNKLLNNSNSLLQSTLNERPDIFSPCISNSDSKLHEQSFDSFSIAEMTQLLNNTCNTSRIEDEVLFNSSKCVSSSAAKPSAVDDRHGLSLFPLSDIAETIVCSARKASHVTMRPSSVKQSSSHKRMVKLIDGSGMVGEILNSGSKIGREAASVEEPIYTDDVKKCLFETDMDFIDGEELDLDEGLDDILARMSNSPVKKCVSPVKKYVSPVKKCMSPVKKCASSVKKCESLVKKCESPVKKCASSVKKYENSAKKCESPVKKCKSPVKKCESLYPQSKPVKAIPKTPVSKGGNTGSYTSSFKKPSQNAKPYISSSARKENVPVTKNVTRFGISKTPNEKPKKTAEFVSKSLNPPRFCKKTEANEMSKPNQVISSLKRPILLSKTPPKIGKVLPMAKTELTSSQNLTTPSKVIPKSHPTQHSASKSRFGFCPEKAQSIASSLPRKTAKNLTPKKYLNIQSPVGKYIQESPASPLIQIVKADDGKAFTLPKTYGQSIDVPSHDLWTTSKTGIPILPPAKYTTKGGSKPIVKTTLLKPKPVLKVRNTPAPVVTKHIGSSKVVEGHNYLANEESLLDLSEQRKSIKPPRKYQCDMDTTLVQEVEIVHSNTLTKSLKKVK